MSKQSPLHHSDSIPVFEQFKVSQVKPAITDLLQQAQTAINLACSQQNVSWDETLQPVSKAVDQLQRAWGQVSHLNSVMSNDELRKVFNELLPRVTEFFSRLSQNQEMYGQCVKLAEGSQYKLLDEEKKKSLNDELRDYKLGGVGLKGKEQRQYLEVSKQLATLSAKFNDNVLDATDDYTLTVTDYEVIKNLPKSVVSEARKKSESMEIDGWVFTLHAPSWAPFMESCTDRSLREEMYRAYVTRASELGNDEFDNSQNIVQILANRRVKAELLGFQSYANLSFETKMARGPEEAIELLTELSRRARPRAKTELTLLQEYAKEELQITDLQAWDISYVAQKIKKEQYSFNDEDLRKHFPLRKVLTGLFRLVQKLYGISIEEIVGDVWHPSVKLLSVSDSSGDTIGYFYMDLFARKGKRSGAWMDDAVSRWRSKDHFQQPVAYLVCNFPSPIDKSTDSFISHYEVETLFHEMGHVMHHVLTKIDEVGISGINGVEWDAVELPSQFMENFCWDWETIKSISVGDSGEGYLPREIFEKMLASKNFMSGIQTLRQVEFSLVDLYMHMSLPPKNRDELNLIIEKVRSEVSVFKVPPYNRFINSFSHIFAGGYAAGYYSYKWAEVLSADAFSALEEDGLAIEEIGEKFLDEIISKGGLRASLTNFERFRGRKPKIDALLIHSGLVSKISPDHG